MVIFGASLVAYAAYSIATPANGHALSGSWPISVLVGMAGGIIGGFTAFPGAAVVVWIGRRGFAKAESRAIVQPYIFAMQLVSLAMLAVQHPSTFNSGFWSLFAINIVVVLPGTLLGVYIHKSLSDVNFRRVSFSLLGTSGVAIFTKGVGELSIATGLLSTMTHQAAGLSHAKHEALRFTVAAESSAAHIYFSPHPASAHTRGAVA